jgi:DNA-directed RNA polymerase specialized sigma24 family protein
MSLAGSVSTWIQQLRGGDSQGAENLWRRYYPQLVHLARDNLEQRLRRGGDEEDVALAALASFCVGITAGRFPLISDRESLWRLLFTITLCKVCDHVRRETRTDGEGGSPVLAGDLLAFSAADLDLLPGTEPDPAWAAAVADQVGHLLACLPGNDLRQVAQALMEGYVDREIAEQLGCGLRTVERKRRVIRQFWREHVDD